MSCCDAFMRWRQASPITGDDGSSTAHYRKVLKERGNECEDRCFRPQTASDVDNVGCRRRERGSASERPPPANDPGIQRAARKLRTERSVRVWRRGDFYDTPGVGGIYPLASRPATAVAIKQRRTFFKSSGAQVSRPVVWSKCGRTRVLWVWTARQSHAVQDFSS